MMVLDQGWSIPQQGRALNENMSAFIAPGTPIGTLPIGLSC
jgi:hypothetical protein